MNNNLRKLSLLLALILLSITMHSQSLGFEWAKSFGGTSADQVTATVTDLNGNVYIAGIFNNTIDMDPGPAVYNLTSAGSSDVFIAKLDALGNFIWAKQIGNSFLDNCRDMNIDASGNLYLTGFFYETVDFDPGPAVYNLTCTATGQAVYLLKLDGGGNFVWAKKFADTDYNSIGYAIAATQSGNIYVTGIFKGTVDFDPGPPVVNLTSTGSSHDIFISRFDNNGNFSWVRQFAGPDGETPYAMTTDVADNIYLTGLFTSTCDFDPGPAVYNLTSLNFSTDVFISKLDLDGNFIFAKQIGGDVTD